MGEQEQEVIFRGLMRWRTKRCMNNSSSLKRRKDYIAVALINNNSNSLKEQRDEWTRTNKEMNEQERIKRWMNNTAVGKWNFMAEQSLNKNEEQ